MKAARQWRALPYPGALMDQPWIVLRLGGMYLDYADAFAAYQANRDGQGPSYDWVREVMAESVSMRERGEEP